MENLTLDFNDEAFFTTNNSLKKFLIQSDNDGVKFPKADLCVSKEGLTKISTGDKLNNIFKINPEDFEMGIFIGMGSSGYVQEAIYKPNNFSVAIKTVNVFDKEKRHQMMNDLKLYLNKEFYCENLIQFFGAYFYQDTIKIVLELMDLGSLREILKLLTKMKSQPPFVEEIFLARITYQILKGLAFLHTKKHQIHRDIKPENILVNSLGKVKLSDFGISKELGKTQSLCSTFVGTMTYMSPERMQGLEYEYSSDLWSLGLIIYELSTGKYPYPLNLSFIEVIQNIIISDAPRLPEKENYSKELQDFLQICLNKDRSLRSSASDLLKHPWILKYCSKNNDLSEWITSLITKKVNNTKIKADQNEKKAVPDKKHDNNSKKKKDKMELE